MWEALYVWGLSILFIVLFLIEGLLISLRLYFYVVSLIHLDILRGGESILYQIDGKLLLVVEKEKECFSIKFPQKPYGEYYYPPNRIASYLINTWKTNSLLYLNILHDLDPFHFYFKENGRERKVIREFIKKDFLNRHGLIS